MHKNQILKSWEIKNINSMSGLFDDYIADYDIYTSEKECTYNDEIYTVRDNGAVFRHSKICCRNRKNDNFWTYGVPNDSNYLFIASVPIHRIVATAFHGKAPDTNYVVDHIDTNRHNNRPDNLRWVTRLENILNNPITRRRIIMLCGSIEEFLADPSKLHSDKLTSNLSWMRRVTPEEAKICLGRLNSWAEEDISPVRLPVRNKVKMTSDNNLSIKTKHSEWMFKEQDLFVRGRSQPLNPNVFALYTQERDSYENYIFPLCPQLIYTNNPLTSYFMRLRIGHIFCHNDFNRYEVRDSGLGADLLNVLCYNLDEDEENHWRVIQIKYEDNQFVHIDEGLYRSRFDIPDSAFSEPIEYTRAKSIFKY